MKRTKLAIALEAIAFQSEVFFKELTDFFEEFKKGGLSKAKPEELKRISSIIEANTNIKTEITHIDFSPNEKNRRWDLVVDMPVINRNNPLMYNFMRMGMSDGASAELLKKNAGIMSGWVDLKRARVGGVYAEVVSKISIPLDMVYAMDADEMASIIIHEVGHIFTFFENTTRTVTTNYALKTISDAILSGKDSSVREHILIDIQQALRLSTKDIDIKELSKVENVDIVQAVILNGAAQTSRSELGSDIYDIVGTEYLADQFVSRFGAQRALVSAIDKVTRISRNRLAYRSTPRYLGMEVIKMAFYICPFTHSIANVMIQNDQGEATYDRVVPRMNRLRDQLIEQMKQEDFDKTRTEQLKADIELVDAVIAEIKDRSQWYDSVARLFSSSRRKNFKAGNFQNELEKLASNDLFLKARELQSLT